MTYLEANKIKSNAWPETTEVGASFSNPGAPAAFHAPELNPALDGKTQLWVGITCRHHSHLTAASPQAGEQCLPVAQSVEALQSPRSHGNAHKAQQGGPADHFPGLQKQPELLSSSNPI